MGERLGSDSSAHESPLGSQDCCAASVPRPWRRPRWGRALSALTAAAIIRSLERDDVIQALHEIDREGIPKRRQSTKFCLAHGRRHYPPKLAISYASAFRYADEPEFHEGLDPNEFAGGSQSNGALSELGFTIVECSCGGIREDASKTDDLKGQPRIARIVVNGRAAMKQDRALRCLGDIAHAMQKGGLNYDIVTTPGGFIEESVEIDAQPIGWNAPASAFRKVAEATGNSLRTFLHQLGKICIPADFLTLGVDAFLPSNDEEYANAQLVATIDLKAQKVIAWTGKSYPTLGEERELIHETDLKSHLQQIGRWKCLVLGCHDLNMFSPRSIATRDPHSQRGKRADDLMRIASSFDPRVVLQHPHNTDTPNIWMGGWAGVAQSLRAESYSSGIAFHWHGHGKIRRSALEETLQRTKRGNVTDYVWSGVGKVKVVS